MLHKLRKCHKILKFVIFPCICIVEGQPWPSTIEINVWINCNFLKFLSLYVFGQYIQYLKGLIKIVVSIDALKFRLLWAKYQYVHEDIRAMNMCHL